MKNKWIFIWYSIFMLLYFLLNIAAKYYLRGIFFILPYIYFGAAIVFCVYFGVFSQKGKEKADFYDDFKRQLWFLGILLIGSSLGLVFVKSFPFLCDCLFLVVFYISFLLFEFLFYYSVRFLKRKKRIGSIVLLFILFFLEYAIYGFLYICLFGTYLSRM